MEDKFRFLQESLELIQQTQGNAERVYAYWRRNIDQIDASLVQIVRLFASYYFTSNSKEECEFTARIFGSFGSLIQQFPCGNRRINLELAITS